MVEDLAALRNLLDVIEVVAVELMEIDLGRDIVEFAADEIVHADDLMPLCEHRISQMATEKARDAGDEYFHDYSVLCASLLTVQSLLDRIRRYAPPLRRPR